MGSDSAPRPQVRPPRLAYIAWGAVCLIWGTTYLGIRIALETIPPGLLGGIRFTLAGFVLCALVKVRGDRLPPASAWFTQAFIGIIMLAVGNGFVVVAEQWIPSGIAAVGVASAPFWMAGIDAAAGGERVTARTLTGFCLGFTGILILIWPDLIQRGSGGTRFVAGVVLVQVACLGWSIGSSLSKRFTPGIDVLAGSAVQQLCGGLALLAAGSLAGEWTTLSFNGRTAIAELYLIVFGSLGAYSAYVYALQHLPIATVSLYAYVNPIIAVVLGTMIAGEPFSPRVAAAVMMVLGGIAVVRGWRKNENALDRPERA